MGRLDCRVAAAGHSMWLVGKEGKETEGEWGKSRHSV